jgi:HEAT repeat protein
LYLVTVFELEQHGEQVRSLLEDSHPFIRLKAFWTMSAIGNINNLPVIINLIERDKYDFNKLDQVVYVLENLTSTNEEEINSQISDSYQKTQNTFVRRCLLEVLGRKDHDESISFLMNQLQDRQSEIRIGAMKSLIYIKAVTALPVFTELLKWSESDGVKIIAMKGIALLGGEPYRSLMIEHLGHELWWVRYYSAFGIAGLSEQGKSELKFLAENHPDPFARQMANYYLQILDKEGVTWHLEQQALMIG